MGLELSQQHTQSLLESYCIDVPANPPETLEFADGEYYVDDRKMGKDPCVHEEYTDDGTMRYYYVEQDILDDKIYGAEYMEQLRNNY